MAADPEHSRPAKVADCVSVIIPTRNSARTIGKCLDSIKQQVHKNVEVFVIDNFSSDDTPRIASNFDIQFFSFAGERAKAKNFGISKSRGRFLLFVDSDMILRPNVIEECVRICSSNRRAAGVIIPERSIGSGFWVRVRDFERSLYKGTAIESPRFFVKEYVTQVGGFDEEVVAYEESTLPQRLENVGVNVNARITSLILHDEEGFNLRKWLHKKRYYSITSSTYSNKYRRYADMQFSISYRIRIFFVNGNWKNLIKHPVLAVGVFVLKSLEYFSSIRN